MVNILAEGYSVGTDWLHGALIVEGEHVQTLGQVTVYEDEYVCTSSN